jgi:hypothetical protein
MSDYCSAYIITKLFANSSKAITAVIPKIYRDKEKAKSDALEIARKEDCVTQVFQFIAAPMAEYGPNDGAAA